MMAGDLGGEVLRQTDAADGIPLPGIKVPRLRRVVRAVVPEHAITLPRVTTAINSRVVDHDGDEEAEAAAHRRLVTQVLVPPQAVAVDPRQGRAVDRVGRVAGAAVEAGDRVYLAGLGVLKADPGVVGPAAEADLPGAFEVVGELTGAERLDAKGTRGGGRRDGRQGD